jgi:hypothetical protein
MPGPSWKRRSLRNSWAEAEDENPKAARDTPTITTPTLDRRTAAHGTPRTLEREVLRAAGESEGREFIGKRK